MVEEVVALQIFSFSFSFFFKEVQCIWSACYPELFVCTSWCLIICMKDTVVPCLSLFSCAWLIWTYLDCWVFPKITLV